MHSWSTFGAQISHRQTWIHKIHKTHHVLDLGEANIFPLIVFSMFNHKACTQMSFCPRIPKLGIRKFSKLGLSQLWRPVTLCENLRLRLVLIIVALIKSFPMVCGTSPSRKEISRNFGLLMVRSQIGNLTPGPSFGHNLCFKYPNGSCKLILNIYVSRSFQWYKELFNLISFGPCNFPLKIWKSIETPTPKVGAHLGVCGFIPSHFPTLLGA